MLGRALALGLGAHPGGGPRRTAAPSTSLKQPTSHQLAEGRRGEGHPDTKLTELALSLQYVYYAHFSRRYREVIGETPDQTRAARAAES